MLVLRPGEVVTRQELQRRLWPVDTYVDFEHSLNAAVKRLRAALGDSAQSPRFVETLARRGYRFIAPVSPPVEIVREASAGPVEERASGKLEPEKRRGNLLIPLALTALLMLAAVGFALVGSRSRPSGGTASPPIRSLAVLPLANLSGDREQDPFVEGMTDELRHHLEGIRSLRVISRTSSMHYRGTGKSLPQIARELNVDAVVEGSVLRSGDRVRINIELSQAATDKRLWSYRYDGDLRDVLALQATVAGRIAGEIRVTLTPADRERLARMRATRPDAYQAYSKGRFYWNKRTADDLKRAIGFFQQAIDLDPDYALAYDGLADSWVPLGWYGYLPPAATFPHAQTAVMRALSLDGSLAEAHTSLAFVQMYHERDWPAAEREFRRAIELNPNYANAHHWYAEFLSLVGRHNEAIAESQRARELDPLSNIINAWVSSRYLFSRQYDRAVEEGRNAVEMDSDFAPALMVLGQAYEQKGMLNDAIAQFEKAASLERCSIYAAALAHAYGSAGRRAEASKVVEDLTSQSARGFISSYDMALAHLGLGEDDRVWELLAAAVRERSPRASFLGADPRFDRLRSDPRFKKLLRSLGLQL